MKKPGKKALFKEESIVIEPVDKSKNHKKLLFELFKKRNKETRISSSSRLSFQVHEKFVETNPYRYWFLVKKDSNFIGSVYVTYENFIGIFLVDKHIDKLESVIRIIKNQCKPLQAIPSVRNMGFSINVSIENKILADELQKMGANLIQKTYAID